MLKKLNLNIYSTKKSIKLFSIFLAIILITPAAFSESKKNQATKKEKKDFGAETVEPLEPLVKPLPPSMVEEKLTTNNESTKDSGNEEEQTEDLVEVKNPHAKKPKDNNEKSEDANGSLTASLNGNEIEIATLVKAFSKITKRNYIVDNNVKGKVAIHLATPVSMAESLRIFESVLLLKGFTTVPMGNNTWKVISAKDARQTTIPMLSAVEDKNTEALVTQLIRLKNTQASELQQAITQFVSKEGVINSFAATNSLIIIDTASNIKRLTKLVNELDVPALDQDLTIIPIQHADAKDIAEKINDILGSDKDAKDSTTNTTGRNLTAFDPTKANITNTALRTSSGSEKRQLPLKLIPDERTNSIIVVADPYLTEKVKALVEQLDSSIDRSGGRFYVYRLKHADAEQMAEIIGALISGSSQGSSSGSSKSKSSSSSSSSFGGSSRNNRNSFDSETASAFGSSRSSSKEKESTKSTGTTFSSGDGGKVSLDGEVSVAADSSTNSLIISASKADYLKIKDLIDSLDVKRQQVLVEATILEVSLDNQEGMGVELQSTAGTDKGGVIGQTNFGGITNLLTNPSALSDLTIAAASSGSIVLPGGLTLPSQALLVSALSNNSNVNVLSAPTILATDNEEAEIKVGENVPFVTGTSTNNSNLNNTFNEIERQDVGIKLKITPQISAGDFVVLKIFVEISNVVEGTRGDTNGPTTTLRTTETMVEVKSDQMIVTGGLISDSVTDSDRGIPYLKEIPILGNLFRKDQNRQRRTNLLVFITPKIVEDQFVAREATLEKRDYMEKVIKQQNASPNREEVLHSNKMNQVVEVEKLEENLPSTLTAKSPEALRANVSNSNTDDLEAQKRTQERLQKIMQSPEEAKVSTKEKTTEEGELNFKVKPKLPKLDSK